jgi:hypothetical protein
MPLMPTILPEGKADREVVTYVHRRGSNVRIQLEATDDIRDARGRLMERGKTLYAQFDKGLFTTNIGELQELLENSYAFEAKEVEKQSVLEERAIEQQLDSLMSIAEKNPTLAKELRSRLTKMQMAGKVNDQAKATGQGPGSVEEVETDTEE